MNKKIVLDASSVIALLNQEKGFEIVEENINNSIISSVNLSEVLTIANRVSNNIEITEELIRLFKNNIVDFDEEQAVIAAILDNDTKKYGLSLGDRACLALAKYKNYKVLTADKIWKEIDIGVDIILIR